MINQEITIEVSGGVAEVVSAENTIQTTIIKIIDSDNHPATVEETKFPEGKEEIERQKNHLKLGDETIYRLCTDDIKFIISEKFPMIEDQDSFIEKNLSAITNMVSKGMRWSEVMETAIDVCLNN